MKLLNLLLFIFVGFAPFALAEGLSPLQALINNAEVGATVAPPKGVYKGPIYIFKPITLDGKKGVTVDAGGKGTVLTIKTSSATVKNMRLVNSGDQHNETDSGIQVKGSNNIIEDNVLEDVLFGIDLSQSNNNIIRRNKISSKPYELGLRGDGIRLWYSKGNQILDNTIEYAKDFVIWYSENNTLKGNKVSHGRYGMHFMYSLYNLVEDNEFYKNSIGIFLMYSDSVVIKNNKISHGLGATGMGIGMKESSDVTVEGNEIFYCSTGLYLDVSPYQPGTKNLIYSNHIAYNSIGILFHNDWHSNIIKNNRFDNNFSQVSVAGWASANGHDWDGNYWDDYQGFDEDKNNIGDKPYNKYTFADRIWMDIPFASFYRGSPVLSLIDLLERLAPFTEPLHLLTDKTPKMAANSAPVVAMSYEKPKPNYDGEYDDYEDEEAYDEDEKEPRYDPFGLYN